MIIVYHLSLTLGVLRIFFPYNKISIFSRWLESYLHLSWGWAQVIIQLVSCVLRSLDFSSCLHCQFCWWFLLFIEGMCGKSQFKPLHVEWWQMYIKKFRWIVDYITLEYIRYVATSPRHYQYDHMHRTRFVTMERRRYILYHYALCIRQSSSSIDKIIITSAHVPRYPPLPCRALNYLHHVHPTTQSRLIFG